MVFNVNTAFWQLAPFFPKFVREKNIDKMWVGIVMSGYAFVFLLASLYSGKYLLNKIKRIEGCLLGAVFVIFNLLGFSCLEFVESPNKIIVLSIIFQMIGGVGNGIGNSSAMSLLSSYKEQRDEYIGYFEVCGGLGAIFGPLMGSILYAFFGFMGPFLGLGIIQTIPIVGFIYKKDSIPLREDYLK